MTQLQRCCIIILLIFKKVVNISSGTPTKESVKCKSFEENRRVYEFGDGDRKIEKEHKINVVKCNLDKNSGFPYNYFGFNISDAYNFTGYSKSLDSEKISNLFEISLENGDIQLLPDGFDTVFPRINSLNITNSGLAHLNKQNLRQFGEHLKMANFSRNFLTTLTDDLFQYNKNIMQCDFSDNFLAHIDIFFLKQPKIPFNFDETSCYNSLTGIINSDDCNMESLIVNYKDLEFHMRRKFVVVDVICSVDDSCSNEYNSENCSVIYNCNTTKITSPRTFFSNFKTQILNRNQIDRYIDEKSNLYSSKITLEFINNFIEFIPENVTQVIRNIEKFNIIRSNLAFLNEFDMKQFGSKIVYADFSYNVLLTLSKNAFKHNTNLLVIILKGNSIYHIDPKYYVLINNGAINRTGE